MRAEVVSLKWRFAAAVRCGWGCVAPGHTMGRWRRSPHTCLFLTCCPSLFSFFPTIGPKRCYPRSGALASYFWEVWVCVGVEEEGTLPSMNIRGVCVRRESGRLLELSLSAPVFLCPSVLFPLLQARSWMATQEINLLIDLSEGLGM